MARTQFGGNFASWVVQVEPADSIAEGAYAVVLPRVDIPLELHETTTDGPIADDFIVNGTPTTQIVIAANNPYIPLFEGPDGVTDLWVLAEGPVGSMWLKIPQFDPVISAGVGPEPPARLTIYYGIPQGVNGVWNNELAAIAFSNFDAIVFGGGLEDSGHTYHTSTIAIIDRIKQLNPRAVVYGYVDVGVNNGGTNLSEAAMQSMVDDWKAIGAEGILLDQFGYDYGVSRARQNVMINYCHTELMATIINVWDMDDAFSSDVDATYNPTGVATAADERDTQLLESWIVSTGFGDYTAPWYAPTGTFKARGDAARTYRASLGVKFFGSSIVDYQNFLTSEADAWFAATEGFSRIFGADGWGMDAVNYAAGPNNANVLKLWSFQNETYNRTNQYTISDVWDIFSRTDLQLAMEYNSTNGTWNRVQGGATNGTSVKLAGGNVVELVTSGADGLPFFRYRIPNDGSSSSGWPNRYEYQYYDSSTSQFRLGHYINEKGLPRARGVTPTDVVDRVRAHPNQTVGTPITEVTKDDELQKILQVFLDNIISHVGFQAPYLTNLVGERLYFGSVDVATHAAYANYRPRPGDGILYYG